MKNALFNAEYEYKTSKLESNRQQQLEIWMSETFLVIISRNKTANIQTGADFHEKKV